MSASYTLFSTVRGETPTPLLALPCGSRSTSSVRRSAAATLAARFTAVVVLPTPPFWLTTAMTRAALPLAHASRARLARLARLARQRSGLAARELAARQFVAAFFGRAHVA